LLLNGQQDVGHFSSGISPSFHWLEDCANFTPMPEEKTTNTAPTTLSAIQQQATLLLTMSNNTPLVISGNDKNRQLTLLRQCTVNLH
jgi:hypothetical protein